MPPTKKTVLDLPLRRRIVETVAAHPGIHLRKLADELGVAVSTLEYHCYQLVKTEHLNTRASAGYKSFYPASGVDRRDKDILYIVRQEAPRRICAHLLLHPGATPKQLKQVLGLSGATLTFHLNKLRKLGLLEEEPAGRTKLLRVAGEERVANVLVSYRQSFVDQTVDRFASAWLDLHPPARDAPANGPSSVDAAVADDADGEAEGREAADDGSLADNVADGREAAVEEGARSRPRDDTPVTADKPARDDTPATAAPPDGAPSRAGVAPGDDPPRHKGRQGASRTPSEASELELRD